MKSYNLGEAEERNLWWMSLIHKNSFVSAKEIWLSWWNISYSRIWWSWRLVDH